MVARLKVPMQMLQQWCTQPVQLDRTTLEPSRGGSWAKTLKGINAFLGYIYDFHAVRACRLRCCNMTLLFKTLNPIL